ncbi:MAG: zf-HC2 domain-containing protein, partial [Chloroflexia bacterium]
MMQQRSCEEMPLLISKYVDDAASAEEREFVDDHVAACETCSCKLTEYMEVAALFSESPMFVPAPQVRQGVFREIERLKEEDRQSKTAKEAKRGWFRPFPTVSTQMPVRTPSFALRLMRAASPFAAASIGVMAIFSLILLNTKGNVSYEPLPVVNVSDKVGPPVPTIPAAAIMIGFPSPISTSGTSAISAPAPSVSAPVRATATLGRASLVHLTNATPVFEEGLVNKTSTWHIVRDPASGYTISYPPNWWTQVRGSTRFFFPWSNGGTLNAPYYLDLRVESNMEGLTAETANLKGACTLQPSGKNGLLCLRTNTQDGNNAYDEIYGFDSKNIYVLRLTVPRRNAVGSFKERWGAAQSIFSRMTSSVTLSPETTPKSDYGRVLFLNGTDLWSVGGDGEPSQPVTRGYGVRQFALSDDLRSVAIATNLSGDLWARHLYLSRSVDSVFAEPVLLWSAVDIHDIAWYGDRQLLAIATSAEEGFGIYNITLPMPGAAMSDQPIAARLITRLEDSMSGARGLAVSPDRQLVSFLAPLAENKGTDIYAVRPDGSDLRKLISHTEPLSPLVDGQRVLPAENQAIKSYLWTDGRLEKAGYE